MSKLKTATLENLAGSRSTSTDNIIAGCAKALEDYVECRDWKLYWKKKPSQPVKVGDEVGCNVGGYLRFKFDGRTYANHRVIFYLYKGYWPELVDHADGNTKNNNINNLRDATHSENKANSKPHRARKAKGSYLLPSGRYMSVIQKEGARNYLGVFDTEELAQAAFALAANELHGQFARAV